MARTRSLVRITVELWREWRSDTIQPGPLFEAVNRELCQNNDDRMFVTMFLGLFDTQTGVLSFVNAGHPPPHLLRAGGDAAQIDAKPALPLGVRRHAKFEGRTLALQPGDALFVCSDGVFEALNEKGDLFSIERLNRELSAANGAEPIEIVRVIKNAVDTFTGAAPKADDVTALALRWRPVEQKSGALTRSVDLLIHNDLAEIAVIRDALDQLGNELGVPPRVLMQLQVAADEIVSNVVKYSWADGEKHEFLVRITANEGGVALDIFDDGKPFDPRGAPDSGRPPSGTRPAPGGVGIQLVKKLVDDFAYERIAGRNHTRLTKKWAANPGVKEIDP